MGGPGSRLGIWGGGKRDPRFSKGLTAPSGYPSNCSANEGQVREKYFHLCHSVVFVLCDKPTTVRGKWGSRHFGRAAVVSCFVFAFYFLRSEGKSRSPHPGLQPLSLDLDHLEKI